MGVIDRGGIDDGIGFGIGIYIDICNGKESDGGIGIEIGIGNSHRQLAMA